MSKFFDLYRNLASLKPRLLFFLGFLSCVAMELSALYFQFVLGLEPCPLCITQRLVVLTLALVFLTAAVQNPGTRGTSVYAGLGALISLTGASVAAYHFMIQILPHEDLSSCGPGASYILGHFKLTDGIRLFLTGTGDCTQIVWTFLGLSMPFWVTVAFFGLLALNARVYSLATPPRTELSDDLAVTETD